MNRRGLIKRLLCCWFISPLSSAQSINNGSEKNLIKLFPSIFLLNNNLEASNRYKLSFNTFDLNREIKVYYKKVNGKLCPLQQDIFFDKGFFHFSDNDVIDVYVYPRTPVNLFDMKKNQMKFISDIFLGETNSNEAQESHNKNNFSNYKKYITPEYFGAVGDSLVDDTLALNKAISSGYSVLFSARYLINSSISPVNKQHFMGINNAEIIIKTPETSLIKTKGVCDVVIKGLILTTYPSISKPYNGACIENEEATGWYIGGNIFSGYGASAIFCRNATNMLITNNKFIGVKNAAGDITMWGSSQRNQILNNFMHSGSDSAIIIQTISNGDACYDNIIQGNDISNCTRYGIVVYNNLESKSGVLHNTKILWNKIDSILGEVSNPSVRNTRTYGAGIYVLSAEASIIQNNTITRCNLQTNSSTLAPGCIGLNATSDAIISDNLISGGAYYGIFIGDALQQGQGVRAKSLKFLPDSYVQVYRNKITGCERDGIYIINKHRVRVNNNILKDNKGSGLSTTVSNNKLYGDLYDISLIDNISHNNGVDGVNLSSVNNAIISGGIFSANRGSGVNISSPDVSVSHAKFENNKVGVLISTKGTDCRLENCIFSSNDIGVLAGVPYENNDCAFLKNKLNLKDISMS